MHQASTICQAVCSIENVIEAANVLQRKAEEKGTEEHTTHGEM